MSRWLTTDRAPPSESAAGRATVLRLRAGPETDSASEPGMKLPARFTVRRRPRSPRVTPGTPSHGHGPSPESVTVDPTGTSAGRTAERTSDLHHDARFGSACGGARGGRAPTRPRKSRPGTSKSPGPPGPPGAGCSSASVKVAVARKISIRRSPHFPARAGATAGPALRHRDRATPARLEVRAAFLSESRGGPLSGQTRSLKLAYTDGTLRHTYATDHDPSPTCLPLRTEADDPPHQSRGRQHLQGT